MKGICRFPFFERDKKNQYKEKNADTDQDVLHVFIFYIFFFINPVFAIRNIIFNRRIIWIQVFHFLKIMQRFSVIMFIE